jgi:hypothetical protein
LIGRSVCPFTLTGTRPEGKGMGLISILFDGDTGFPSQCSFSGANGFSPFGDVCPRSTRRVSVASGRRERGFELERERGRCPLRGNGCLPLWQLTIRSCMMNVFLPPFQSVRTSCIRIQLECSRRVHPAWIADSQLSEAGCRAYVGW